MDLDTRRSGPSQPVKQLGDANLEILIIIFCPAECKLAPR